MMKSIAFLILTSTLICSVSASAQNKVVVIPMEGSVPLRIYYGSITSSGTLETGNLSAATRNSEGSYSLDAGADVGGCAATVTKGSQGGGVSNIYGNTSVSVPSSGNSFNVRTRDKEGVLDDTDFHFIAVCAK